jgi:hypothetical protein
LKEPPKKWPIVLAWLGIFKIGYLGLLCGALWLSPDFDQNRQVSIAQQWFNSQSASSVSPSREESRDKAPRAERTAYEKPVTAFCRYFQTWDAQHYLYLSEAGYAKGAKSCAFYPLWPMVIRSFSALSGVNPVLAGMLLANVFSLAAWTILYSITAARFGEETALWTVIFLVVFPGSLFCQFIYSEPLFCLLVMLLWRGLERGRTVLAWIAGFFLPLTRAVGVFSVLPICWRLGDELWKRRVNGRDDPNPHDSRQTPSLRAWFLLAAPPLGLGFYFLLMGIWTGNPFEGMQAQKYWGVHSIGNLWNVPKFVAGFFEPTAWHDFSGSVLDRSAFLLVVCCLPLIWRLGKDLLIWTYVLAILPAMSGTFVSFTRFESTAFPVFIALALFFAGLRPKWPRMLLLALFGQLHLLLLWRFVNFRWAG